MTGIVTVSWIPLIIAGSLMRATPPSRRMSAGTRSSAITADAPPSSAIFAGSGVTTSMITPPLSISARPALVRNVASSRIRSIIRAGSVPPWPTRASGRRRHGGHRAEPDARVREGVVLARAREHPTVRQADDELAVHRGERVGHRRVRELQRPPAGVPAVQAPAGTRARVGGARPGRGGDPPPLGV